MDTKLYDDLVYTWKPSGELITPPSGPTAQDIRNLAAAISNLQHQVYSTQEENQKLARAILGLADSVDRLVNRVEDLTDYIVEQGENW